MRSKSFKTLSYSVFYEQALEGGYAAFIPTLPGSQDDSLEEPDRNVEEAITLYLDRLPSNGEAAPSPLRPDPGPRSVSDRAGRDPGAGTEEAA
jgi:predicted RNase H-like HicB family nuclease